MNAIKITTKGLRCPFVVLEKDGKRIEVRGVTHFADRFFFERVYSLKPGQVIQHEAVMCHQTHNPLYVVTALYIGLLKLGLVCQSRFMISAKKCIHDDFEDSEKVKSAFRGHANTLKNKGAKLKIEIPSRRIDFCEVLVASLVKIRGLCTYVDVVSSRDETAALYSDYASDSDIVLIWGTAHVPGIVKNLKDLGWKKLSTRWITAIAL